MTAPKSPNCEMLNCLEKASSLSEKHTSFLHLFTEQNHLRGEMRRKKKTTTKSHTE